MIDHDLHQYRYVRGLGGGAALHAVTFDGIEDFLDGADSREAGIAILLWDSNGCMTSQAVGADSIAEVMKVCQNMRERVREVARPIAVVSVPRKLLKAGTAVLIAKKLMQRIAVNAVGPLPPETARYLNEGVPEVLPEAGDLVEAIMAETPTVLGDDPFQVAATFH